MSDDFKATARLMLFIVVGLVAFVALNHQILKVMYAIQGWG